MNLPLALSPGISAIMDCAAIAQAAGAAFTRITSSAERSSQLCAGVPKTQIRIIASINVHPLKKQPPEGGRKYR
jgi:hypothetical protein